jgi:hypothetical protein
MSSSALAIQPINIVPFAAHSLPASTGDTRWLSAAQIAERAGISLRSVSARIAVSAGVIARQSEVRGRNGKHAREILIESLPMDLTAKLRPASQAQKLLPAPPPVELMPLFRAASPSENDGPRIKLTPEQEKLALERYEAIRALDEFAKGEGREKYFALRLKDGRSVKRLDDLAEYIGQTLKVAGKYPSRSTLFRWLASYRSAGLNGLGRKTRSDAGVCHFFSKYPAAAVLVASVFLNPSATAWRAFDALERDRELLRIPESEMPSYSTVRNYLDSLPEAMKILAREGLAAYNTRCAPHLNRKFTDIPVNDIWCADHMTHDWPVRNDCMTGAPKDASIRLQLTLIEDMRSRKFVGYCWTVNGDWRSIATALRLAVKRYGPCRVFYCDNGEDFKKAARGAERIGRPSPIEIQQFAEDLMRGPIAQIGINIQYCRKYAPQSKPIERGNRIVHSAFDAISAHYLTGNAYNRPDQATIAQVEHKKLMKHGLGAASSLMPASFFIKLAETWIEQSYNAGHHHSGRGMDGRTPNEVFDAGYPLAESRTADPDVLAMLLHERRTSLVRRTAITIDGRRYMPVQSSPESWAAIHSANETSIVVAYDPLDPDYVIALDAHGRRMADLVVERLTEHPADGEVHAENDAAIHDSLQMRGRLLKATAGTVKQMHRSVALAGHKTELEHLAELALASVPVDELISQRAVRASDRPADSDIKETHSEDNAARYLARLNQGEANGAQ